MHHKNDIIEINYIKHLVKFILVISSTNLSCGGFDNCTLALPLWVQINIGPILFLVIGIYIKQLPFKRTKKKKIISSNVLSMV